MANALIGFGNTTDSGTLREGAWLSALPLSNLQNRTLGKVARTSNTDNVSTKLVFDATKAVPIKIVGIVNHNLSLVARYRVRVSNDPNFTTLLADSGWRDVWPSVYQSVNLPWGADNFWNGRYSEQDRAGYVWTTIYITEAPLFARYVSVEFDDTSNSAGFIQFGRLFVGDAWQPRINMDIGAALGWQSGTEATEAISGAEYFAVKRPFRVAKFTTGFMDVDEAFSNAFDITRRMGLNGEVIFVFDPSDTIHAVRRQFYGRLRELSPIEYPYATLTSTGWEIKELI